MSFQVLNIGSTTPLLANVASAVGDNIDAVLIVLAAAVAVPLVFWIAHAIKGLFPGSRARSGR